ncbi:hypothetical protein [Peribacillus frigoritolerans]|uniref:hypothetical protein n=1 Tax=Peribacillus frigoritolerans TaxID=450367 RepID=UPI00207A0214|nr:hypothetical protein [Peribacillus frigoritolerans]USK77721.1 hypothetical protein LIT31_26560 [Peribacillus frigoritolerans]USK77869.1 hypothetical protein LIT31_27130 [Peribacillus frigoritolerans]
MSESKAEAYKRKILEEQERKKKEREERDSRKELIKATAKEIVPPEEDPFMVVIDKLVLELKNPEQTFGTKLDRTEHVACFMEPKVKKALMKDQEKKGRGWKSHLVNELVKKYYQDKGKL